MGEVEHDLRVNNNDVVGAVDILLLRFLLLLPSLHALRVNVKQQIKKTVNENRKVKKKCKTKAKSPTVKCKANRFFIQRRLVVGVALALALLGSLF